jgi:hypothetical protein
MEVVSITLRLLYPKGNSLPTHNIENMNGPHSSSRFIIVSIIIIIIIIIVMIYNHSSLTNSMEENYSWETIGRSFFVLSFAPQPSLGLGLLHKIQLNFLEASQKFNWSLS